MLTVVLEADGFADLLERADFLDRITDQDNARSSRACATCSDRTSTRRTSSRSLEQPRQLAAQAIWRKRNEIAAVKGTARVVARTSSRARATTAPGRSPRSAPRAASLRGRPQRSRQSRRRSRRACAARRATAVRRADQARLGPVDLAGERPDRVAVRDRAGAACHAGIDIARARPARRSAPPTPGRVVLSGLVRRLRQLHLHPAHRRAVHLLRPPVGFGMSSGQNVSQGQVIGYVGLHRPLLRAAPALRGAHERGAGGPAGLPVAARPVPAGWL